MKAWTIGQVAKLLGVKPHVLRYWESELPLLSPRKSRSGRREYTANEVRLLMRFRHLLYERKFTLEGAKARLWEELGSVPADVAAKFAEVRSDLIEALMTARGETHPVRDTQGSTHTPADRDSVSESLREQYEGQGQEHLFAFWDERPAPMRARLLQDLEALDPARLPELQAAVLGGGAGLAVPAGIEPAPYEPRERSIRDEAARQAGEEEIRRGRSAFLTVAGGQGSRLGFSGPKGMFPVTPIRKLTLFALFAEKLLAARRRYGAAIPWLIMTGPQNHAATMEYFESCEWFGLGRETVHLFPQGSLPSLSPDGRLVMGADGGLFFNPDGHGGVIEGLRRAGLLDTMAEQGVQHLFYFQVDNPLVCVPDPVFLGAHCRAGSQISAKVVQKAYPEEKLGIIVRADGRPMVIEYSDLDQERMHARDAEGRLVYGQGSIAINLLEVAFLGSPGLSLPWHLARKKAQTLNPVAGGTENQEREIVKLEKFVFDAIPLAERALFFETDRAEEFSPLKNRHGVDSIETCRLGQLEQAARWLEQVGVQVPRDPEGLPRHALEISPLFALDARALAARRGLLKDVVDEDTLLV